MQQQEMMQNAVRQVAGLCAVAAMTAPKSGGQLFSKGAKPFMETVFVDDRPTLDRLAQWLRTRGERLADPIWLRDAATAEKISGVLFIGLARWYPPQYDCGACGYATCEEFSRQAPRQRLQTASDDWEFPGPICQIRCIDLGVAVGSAAKVASMHNVDCRCQTRIAAAARHLKIIEADLAVALALSVSSKNIFFDRKMPAVAPDGAAPPHQKSPPIA